MLGRYEEAYRDLDKAISLDPRHIRSYYVKSRAHEEQKDYDKAIEAISKAIEIGHVHPGRMAGLYSSRIDLYNKTGNKEGHDADMKEFLECKRRSGGIIM
jgi:tetratricopeptide (TPR) repeat protein